MASEAILFAYDQMHEDVTTTSIYADTGVEVGYSRDNIRQTDFGTAWKPDDSSSDEYVRVDGGSTTWLGSVGDTVYVCVAYDARGADQNLLNIRYFPNDDGLSASTLLSFTLNKTEPTCDYATFTIPSNSNGLPKRYYEIVQKNADRGGGTKTAKVYAVAFYRSTGVYRIGTDFPLATTGPGALDQVSNVQSIAVSSNELFTNRESAPQQRVGLSFEPATQSLWTTLRDVVYLNKWPRRATFLYFDGIRNAANSGVGMVRMADRTHPGGRVVSDQVDTSITFLTEPTF